MEFESIMSEKISERNAKFEISKAFRMYDEEDQG